MACFECESGKLIPADIRLTGTRNNESFTVELQGYRCDSCGHETIDSDQSAHFTQLLSDAYREAHGLLLSAEIKAHRLQLGLSQQAFADYLGVGVASVKRWEAGQIQEKAMDQLIRLKTELEVARKNLRVLEQNVPEQHVLSTVGEGDQQIELSFLLDQHFDRRRAMKVHEVRMAISLSDDDQLPLAA